MENWEYSSFRDYLGLRSGSLLQKKIAFDVIGINLSTFYRDSYAIIRDDKIQRLI
jgi:putative transposase